MPFSFGFIALAIVLLYILSSIKILAEYERGVIFRLGRLLPQAKGPGLILVFAPIDRIVRVSLRQDSSVYSISTVKNETSAKLRLVPGGFMPEFPN